MTPLAVALGIGCGHAGGAGRTAAFAEMARALPACAAGQEAMTVDEALGKRWATGTCGVVRGWLALTRDPAPCSEQLGSDPAALPGTRPAAGACGIGWILSSAPPPPSGDGPVGRPAGARIGLSNPVNDGGLAACQPAQAVGRPLIDPVDERDLDAARQAFPALEVVVLGGVHDFRPTPGPGEYETLIGWRPSTDTLHHRALEVSQICRVASGAK